MFGFVYPLRGFALFIVKGSGFSKLNKPYPYTTFMNIFERYFYCWWPFKNLPLSDF